MVDRGARMEIDDFLRAAEMAVEDYADDSEWSYLFYATACALISIAQDVRELRERSWS